MASLLALGNTAMASSCPLSPEEVLAAVDGEADGISAISINRSESSDSFWTNAGLLDDVYY